ncbi:MAG: TraR/DksA C4-type zinc finger protein [Niabella sp.]
MATKKSTPAKKTAPTKKQVKAVKPAAKTAAKKALPAKAAAKKAAPAKPANAVPKNTPAKTVAKPAAKKAVKTVVPAPKTSKKTAAVKVTKPAPAAKTTVKPKPAAKKEQSTKPPVVPKLSTKSAVKYQPDFTKSILDIPKNEKVKSVVRYSDSDLQEFKEIILRKLDAAKKELAYLQGLITRRDEGGDMDEGRYMTMEDGSVSMEREQLSQLASRQITFIDHLEKALMRVENKTYGICRVTGNLIDKARLRAVPHATLSIEAKSMMNK